MPTFKIRACAVFGLKRDTAVSFFLLPLLPSSFVFLASFFSFVGHLLGYGEKRFWESEGGKEGRNRCKEMWVGNENRFSSELSCQLCIVFRLFCRSSWLNCAHSGMVLKISSSCTR